MLWGCSKLLTRFFSSDTEHPLCPMPPAPDHAAYLEEVSVTACPKLLPALLKVGGGKQTTASCIFMQWMLQAVASDKSTAVIFAE